MNFKRLMALAMATVMSYAAVADVSITERQDHLYQDLSAVYIDHDAAENFLVSPKNIADLLALLAIGSGEGSQTRAELAKAVGLDKKNLRPGLQELKELNQRLTTFKPAASEWDTQPTRIKLATSLWANSGSGFEFSPSYVQTARHYLNSQVQSLNFHEAQAVDTINEWVSTATEKMIPKLLGDLPADTASVLISTLFIEGSWADSFEKYNTHEGDFKMLSGESKKLPLMRQVEMQEYYEGKVDDVKFQYIALYTDDHRARLEVYLPETLEGSDTFRKGFLFSKSVLPPLSERQQNTNVDLTLPKFKVGFKDENMGETLAKILPEAMSESANYSAMSIRPLHVGKVIHETVLEVQETGFRAAAASAALMLESAMPRRAEPVIMKVDRPFAVRIVVTDKEQDVELFKGWVASPESL